MTIIGSARIRALSIISIMVIVVLMLLASASQATGEVTATISYRVHPGDTLWSIAQEFGPDGQDTRSIIATIERINELDGAMLQAGQVLELPDISR